MICQMSGLELCRLAKEKYNLDMLAIEAEQILKKIKPLIENAIIREVLKELQKLDNLKCLKENVHCGEYN